MLRLCYRSLYLKDVKHSMAPSHLMRRILSLLICLAFLSGCAAVSDLGLSKPRNVSPEFRQKVGLYVHDKPEKFFYPGTARLDMSDIMSFHLQQTLPFTSQSALQEIFKGVEPSAEGAEIQFKQTDLVGYFEIKISSARYDWPDPNATKYRAEIQLLVEFKTFEDQVIWNGIFTGTGVGFSDTNIRLTRFGRDAATALEDAFQNAIYQMQDAILGSVPLRSYLSETMSEPPPPPAQTPPSPPSGKAQRQRPRPKRSLVSGSK